MSVEKKSFGIFTSHVHNGGVYGNVTGKISDDGNGGEFWDYTLRIGINNFAAAGEYVICVQDPKMVDQMIAALQNLKEHMANNKVAAYI